MNGIAAAMAAAATTLGLIGCAQTGAGQDPKQLAEERCLYFTREQGLTPVAVAGSEPRGANYVVTVRAEDGLTRKLAVSCLYDTSKQVAAWATPLPAGVVLR